jgi:hypothetical protein
LGTQLNFAQQRMGNLSGTGMGFAGPAAANTLGNSVSRTYLGDPKDFAQQRSDGKPVHPGLV